MEEVDARFELEKLARQVHGAAQSRARVRQLTRLLPGKRNHLRQIAGRKRRRCGDEDRRRAGQGYRREIPQRVVRHLLAQRRQDDERGDHHAEGMAVGRGACDVLHAEQRSGARLVVHDDRLAPHRLQLLRVDARLDVDRAARRVRHDEVDGAGGEGLRGRGAERRHQHHRPEAASGDHRSHCKLGP
jgi:hypothetical protein